MHRRTIAFEARLSHVPISQKLQLISLVTAIEDIGAMRRILRFGLGAIVRRIVVSNSTADLAGG